jgi:hypothetical protein
MRSNGLAMPLRVHRRTRCFGDPTRILVVLLLAALAGCAHRPPLLLDARPTAFVAAEDGSLAARFAPVLVPQRFQPLHNRIGTPVARRDADGRVRVSVDPTRPTIYTQTESFVSRAGAHYTNLIYRIHFSEVPFSLLPFHVTAGANGGLLVVITLDDQEHPVLVSNVHTCGCYLAIIPTSRLGPDQLPEDWDGQEQQVFGEQLPGQLTWNNREQERLRIAYRDGTHRIMRVDLITDAALRLDHEIVTTPIEPMAELTRLALEHDGTTSFYYESGRRRGYVKDSFKPWELLLMSWWTLDLRVGVDKEYGRAVQTGTVFYTSLKPWRRRDSDMGDFAAFLAYWGFRL